ncbi:MAG: GYD domain-containing protein [Acidobacteriota bacterium]|nr:GYD domain-containing protein [Blastocatellia bacterium]MDW8239030.1 GYD domain-containing protein [Acidobacteriota bacterium]
MATYILLANWTQQGIENIKESPKRLAAAKEAWQEMGATVKAFYLTMGQYDFVLLVEAPDDETVAKVILAQAAKGSIRTVTLRAFTEPEYRQIIAALP